ncbi:MAG: recombinase family protein [Phycisphaerales bacterium]
MTGHRSTTPQADAVIYCRVSSDKQVTQGHGLESQEMRGRDYAARRGYRVVAVFRDEGVSGALSERPDMQALLAFLRASTSPVVVIIDDISRFARNVEAHIYLKNAIHKAGGRLESPSHSFGDTPEEQFAEIILAGAAELAHSQNTRQVKNRMRDRLRSRIWVFRPPIGYRFARHAEHGRMMVPDEPLASMIKEALEGFACGRFDGQIDVQRFLERQDAFPKNREGGVHLHRVKQLLTCQLYSGYFDFPQWDIGWTQGLHDPLISLATYNRIQERLGLRARRPIAPTYAKISHFAALSSVTSAGTGSQPLGPRGSTRSSHTTAATAKRAMPTARAFPKPELKGSLPPF